MEENKLRSRKSPDFKALARQMPVVTTYSAYCIILEPLHSTHKLVLCVTRGFHNKQH
jgi:hypothetical protein